MLAEIFMLKLEQQIKTTQPAAPATRDPRFVPVSKPR